MTESKMAEERVTIVVDGQMPSFGLYVDGACFERFTEKIHADAASFMVRTAINTTRAATIRECCAIECPHCKNEVPFDERNIDHIIDGDLVFCLAYHIRRETGVTRC